MNDAAVPRGPAARAPGDDATCPRAVPGRDAAGRTSAWCDAAGHDDPGRTAAGCDATGGTAVGQARDLQGRTVLVPRAGRPGHPDRLAEALRGAGAQVVGVPLTRTVPCDPAPLAAALEDLARGHHRWLVITSPRTVDALDALTGSRHLADVLRAARAHGTRLAAVGRASAQALTDLGATVDVVAAGSSASLLGQAALATGAPAGGRALLPCSRLSPPDLAEGLARAGWQVDSLPAYDTVPVEAGSLPTDLRADWERGRPDAAVITSASTARAVADLLGHPHPHTRLVALGASSAAAASRLLHPPDAVAASPTPEGLLDALLRALGPAPGAAPAPPPPLGAARTPSPPPTRTPSPPPTRTLPGPDPDQELL